MMNKEIIKEEIERLKLLMKYDTKKTLSENTVKIISEQWKGALEDMGKVLAHDAEGITRSLENAFKDGTIKMDLMVLEDGTRLTKMADVLESMRMGTLGPSGTGSVAKGLFLRGSSTELRALGADTITSMGKFTEKFTTKGRNEIVDILMKDAKYSKQDAEVLADTYLKKRSLNPSLGKTPPVKGSTSTLPKSKVAKNTKLPVKQRPKNLKPIPGKPTMWQSFKTKIVGMTRSKIFKYLLAAGGLYLLYRWWMDEGSKPFPDCIGKNIPEEDLQKMGEEGLDYVLITDTGNKAIDTNGGGKFFDDKKFVTGNDKYTGKWDETDSGIVITINGTDYAMSCEGFVPEDDCPEGQTWDGEKCVPSGGGRGTTWTNCTSFPYKKGCKNNDIKKIQDCLGITPDGKFGSETEKALKSKGYDVIITQEIYDKIMANCGGTTTTTTIYTPDRNEIGNDDLNK
jgi:hypothetical protein